MDKVVYIHRKKTNLKPFYVGMGSKSRPHCISSRNRHWTNTYNKHGLIVQVIAENLSVEDAYELEVLLISEYGRLDLGVGLLVNLDSGGKGATGHVPTKSARNKLRERLSKKVINTETLEVLSSGSDLTKKYGIFNNILHHKHPDSDWMRLEDYNNGKYLTEEWINRYKIGLRYLKIINTETLYVFYSIEQAAKSIGKGSYRNNESQYNQLATKLKGSKRNNTDFMYYEDYELGKHLTEEFISRKINKPSKPQTHKEIEIYDFKKEVWFKTTIEGFKLIHKKHPVTQLFVSNGRFCRREYFEKNKHLFYKNKLRWKNILDLNTGKVEKFNQSHLANKLNTKSNNLSSFFRGVQNILKKRYKII